MSSIFESPEYLWLLGTVPIVAAALLYAHMRRKSASSSFADAPMLRRLAPRPGTSRAWLKGLALVGATACLAIAAARPRWGESLQEVRTKGVDLFILLDVSRSMTAEDVAPSRLLRAKADIRDLLSKLSGDRVGLIAFAGAAVVRVPLTTDHAFLTNVLDGISVEASPRGGTQIGNAIRKGLETLPPPGMRDQVLVLITDGEDHESLPREAAKVAAERGIKIIAIGLGDPGEGQRIPIRDRQGRLRYLQHEGQEVWSRMDETLLRDLAATTDGAYIPARTRAYDLGQIYEEYLADLTRGEFGTSQRTRYQDRFQLFLAAALLLLTCDLLIARTGSPGAGGTTPG